MYLNVDKEKIMLIMAEKQMMLKELPKAARISLNKNRPMKPKTVGLLAEALGVDAKEIIKDEI